MDSKIILDFNNVGIPESWFNYPNSLEDSDFQTAVNMFEKEISVNFKFDKKWYRIFEGVKQYHVFFFPTLKKETSNERKIKILSAMVVLWLYIIDDYYENNITKANSDEMINQNLKLINILMIPENQLDYKDKQLTINEHITRVIKKFALEIIQDENSIVYNNFISSIYQYITSSVAYYTLLENSTFATYSELRISNSGVLMIESTYLIHWVNLKNQLSGCGQVSNNNQDLIFLNDPRYTRLKWIQCLIVCIHNDLFSSDNEKEHEQHVNSFWIEYKLNNNDLTKTLLSLFDKIKDYVNEFQQLEESLLESYENNNSILKLMITSLKYTISGNILLSINTQRYQPTLFFKGNESNAINKLTNK